MERQRPVSDRIRPILEAMERSIDSARRKRCNTNDRPATPRPASPPTPSGNVNGSHPTHTNSNAPSSDLPRPSGGDDSPPRLKARPKRPMNLNSNSSNNWRTAS